MYGTKYTYNTKIMNSITDAYYYGNDVTYLNGQYTLVDTISSSDWASIYNGGLNKNHYTCFSTDTTYNNVHYIFLTKESQAYYITLTNGKKVEDALSEMLDYNTNSSTIKGDKETEGTLDYWYYTNIEEQGYSSYIEDTIWCNDRSIYSLGGWEHDGEITTNLIFSSKQRTNNSSPSIKCNRNIDKFTVSEELGNGDLEYPVGLLTIDEVMLSGVKNPNTNFYFYTGKSWWTISPSAFGAWSGYGALEYILSSNGGISPADVYFGSNTYGIRPSISLKIGTKISSGDGTVNNPYIINLN